MITIRSYVVLPDGSIGYVAAIGQDMNPMVSVVGTVPGFQGSVVSVRYDTLRRATFWQFLFKRRYMFGNWHLVSAVLWYGFAIAASLYCLLTGDEFSPAWTRYAVPLFFLVAATVTFWGHWRNFKGKQA